ncbi:MAG: HlyD family secretion protein [Chloroflexaceae bacterium]|nr:HlyD family secretion protein [Chloroflexaceae bacterium]
MVEGQVIAVLDSEARLTAALQQAQAEVQTAAARLAQVRAGAKRGEIAAQAARFEQQQAELTGQIPTQRATIATLEAELQGERQAQQAAIDRVAAEARQARTDCDRFQSLFRSGAVAEQERDQACLTAETAQERLQEARANLNRIVSSRQEQIREAQANLERTVATQEQQIAVAQKTLEAIAEVRPVDVEIAASELSVARAAVVRAQADLDQAYVKSPQAGQILDILARPGELVGNEGIVAIGQTQQMYAIAEVYESDIPKVQVGQPVTVTSDALGGELHGTVAEVGLQVLRQDVVNTDATADVDARIVEVKVRLDEESSRKVTGLTNLQITAQIQVDPVNGTN